MPAFSTEIKNHHRASARKNDECSGKNRVDYNLSFHESERITRLLSEANKTRNEILK